jgi:type I restriction enzyme, S subunit
MTTYRFDQIAISVTDRVQPAETDLEYYVGLEHLDPESLKIRRWGSPSDVKGQKLLFRKGDIIFAKRRAYQRKLGVAEFDGICSAHAMVLRPKTDVITAEFLPFFLQSDLFMNRAIEISVGSLSPTINWRTLAEQEFPLPPIDEQCRIADLLWAADDALNTYQALNADTIKLLEATAKELFGKLIENQSVPKKEIKELMAIPISNGIFRKKEEFGSGVPLINVTDIYQDFRVQPEKLDLVPASEKEYEKFSAKPNDVIFNRSSLVKSGIGYATLVPESHEKSVFECHLMRVRPNPKLLFGPYLARFALSAYGRRFFLSRAQTTTMTTINQGDLNAFVVPCPSLSVQKEISSQLDAIEKSSLMQKERFNHLKKIKKQLLNIALG